jgi:hypothetical protein
LEKAELLQIINERPETIAELDCIVEEMDARFTEEESERMVSIIRNKLPRRKAEI